MTATIDCFNLDAPGRVEWWPDPEVTLFDVLVHMLAETSRHAGHADILREEIDGAVGADAESMARKRHDATFWAERREEDRGRREVCGLTSSRPQRADLPRRARGSAESRMCPPGDRL